MKKLLILFVWLGLFVSCADQSRQIIVVPGGGSKDTTDQPVQPAGRALSAACTFVGTPSSLDIATWNLELFPKTSQTTDRVAAMITKMNWDVIAFQEINNQSSFQALVAKLSGWQAAIGKRSTVGFLYKTSEVQFVEFFELFRDDFDAFPRPAAVLVVRDNFGTEITLVCLHLKCCDDGVERRRAASIKLKAYLDAVMPTRRLIVLGDWNDEITGSDVVFQNFISDAKNYFFADTEIARNSSLGWSYPSYPSHIDHILISNELFSAFSEVMTVAPDKCEAAYFSQISDHRPVAIRLVKL